MKRRIISSFAILALASPLTGFMFAENAACAGEPDIREIHWVLPPHWDYLVYDHNVAIDRYHFLVVYKNTSHNNLLKEYSCRP